MKNFSMFFSLLFVALSFIATKAQPWFAQNAPGLPNSADPQVAFSAIDDDVCWGKNNTNSQFLRTTNGGANWTVSTVTGAAGLRCSGITTFDADTAWIAMNDPSNATSGGIFKTTDAGLNWTKQTTAFQGLGGHPNVIHFFDANNGVCVGNPRGGYWEIYTTTSGGTNWIRVDSANIPPPLFGELGIEQRVINGEVTTFWFQTFSNSLYKTTNRGYTWSVAYNVCGSTGFGFAFKDSLNGLAVDYFPINAMSRTLDGGETWTPLPLDTVFSNLSTFYIAYAKGTNGSYVITSHSPGIPGSAYTTDDGNTWTYINNLPLGPAAFSDWNTGWTGGINDTIWKWNSAILVTSVKEVAGTVDNFLLEQNYPNPFNPSTTIRYSIPTSEFVKLKVYDVLGNEVATLVNEEKPAGSYEVEFQATELSSGIYFYKLQSGNFVETKKMLLLK